MIVKIMHKKSGNIITINNSSHENGKIIITGDQPITNFMDKYFNKELMANALDLHSLRNMMPVKKGKQGYEIDKSSDSFMNDYFIPQFCELHGYDVISVKCE